MSKMPQRSKHSHGRSTHAGQKRTASGDGRWRRFLIAGLILLLAGAPFVLGKYFELSYPDPFDSGSYVYSAQHILSGARIGHDEKPSAQAGTLLVNMLGVTLSGFNETGSKILQGLFQAVALALMFVAVRRLYGTLAAAVSVTVASVYLSAPLIAKYGNVKEQFMIALMIMGICSFVFYHLNGKRWWALLTGALLIAGPLFKQTGVSAIGAVGLFTLAQPILHRCGWKKVGVDVLLLIAGAAITMAPIGVWYASMGTPLYYWPYSWAFAPALKLVGVKMEYKADTGKADDSAEARGDDTASSDVGHSAAASRDDSLILRLLPGYVSDSWRLLGPAERKEAFRRVLRYYALLILPIAMAAGAVVARAVVLLRRRRAKAHVSTEPDSSRFVLLFALWWFFDMAFVWISPHSYEQYYLPLNASAAMLGSYLVGLYSHRWQVDPNRSRWVVVGLLSVVLMIVLSWHVFFGIRKSPHTGAAYKDSEGRQILTRGYVQKWDEVAERYRPPRAGRIPAQPLYAAWRSVDERQKGERGAWEQVGQYIREHTEPNDTIYVWGWVPGIYVQAQRMSPTPKAFEGTMHTLPPPQLAERIQEILTAFGERPPKFIVDTRKRHFPWNVPPMELWPLIRQQFLPTDETTVKQYEEAYAQQLGEVIGPDEAARFKVMKPLRDYVMKNYRIVGLFGEQVLFQRKD
ncbi:MAG: hypothetical protein GXY19_00765 [Phycisphaerae bacterium]|nr:hypothetical protein [Phycisphaerae bacterium]